MTDTVAEEATDLPVQVPPPISDPLYAHVIGSLESDLSDARQRAQTAERKVKELSEIADQVETLSDNISTLRNELESTKNLVSNMNQYVEAMFKVINKTFRSS